METALLSLLSSLWLHEPDAAMLTRINTATTGQARLLCTDANPKELAVAYADLFLLNVYPYGTAYTDHWGELNTPAARRVGALFETYAYQPEDLFKSGAPDHLGMCLGFLALVSAGRAEFPEPYLTDLLFWAPVCCLAAEREPAVHPFYRALAQLTRETLLSGEWGMPGDIEQDAASISAAGGSQFALSQLQSRPELVEGLRPEPVEGHAGRRKSQSAEVSSDSQLDGTLSPELRMRDVVRFLLFPERCGLFLSRGRLGRIANSLDMRLPFGSRFEVAEWLFGSAGEGEQVTALLQALVVEAEEWRSAYSALAARWPGWRPAAARWLARVDGTTRLLNDMQREAQGEVEVYYELPVGPDASLAVG